MSEIPKLPKPPPNSASQGVASQQNDATSQDEHALQQQMQECSITDNSRATAAQGTETTRLKAIIDQLEAEKTFLKADIQFSKRQLKIPKEGIKSLHIEHNDEVVELKTTRSCKPSQGRRHQQTQAGETRGRRHSQEGRRSDERPA
jgi:hypothetical protein